MTVKKKDYYHLCGSCLESWIEKKTTGVIAAYVIGIIIVVIRLVSEGGFSNGINDLYPVIILLIIPYSFRHLFIILTSIDGSLGEYLFFDGCGHFDRIDYSTYYLDNIGSARFKNV